MPAFQPGLQTRHELSAPASHRFISISFQQEPNFVIRQSQLPSHHPPKCPIVPSKWLAVWTGFTQQFASNLSVHTVAPIMESRTRLRAHPSTVLLLLQPGLPVYVVHHALSPIVLLRAFTKGHPIHLFFRRDASLLPSSPISTWFWFRIYARGISS